MGIQFKSPAGFDYVSAATPLPVNLIGGVPGVTTNSNAAPGYVGQFVESLVPSSGPVTVANSVATNVTSISLTAGDWDVEGAINIRTSPSGDEFSEIVANITTVSATITANGNEVWGARAFNSSGDIGAGVTIPRRRISLIATTTVYLVLRQENNSDAESALAWGQLTARRVR